MDISKTRSRGLCRIVLCSLLLTSAALALAAKPSKPPVNQAPFGSFTPDISFSTPTSNVATGNVALKNGTAWAPIPDASSRGVCDWSPDGRWVLYANIRTVQISKRVSQKYHEVWARRVDGTGTPQRLYGLDFAAPSTYCASYIKWTPLQGNGKQYLIYTGDYVSSPLGNNLFAREVICGTDTCVTGDAIQLTHIVGNAEQHAQESLAVSALRGDGTSRLAATGYWSATDEATLDLYTLRINTDGNPELTDGQYILVKEGLNGRMLPYPKFSARYPDWALFAHSPVNSAVADQNSYMERIAFNPVDNTPVTEEPPRAMLMRFPRTGLVDWDINAAGDIVFSAIAESLQLYVIPYDPNHPVDPVAYLVAPASTFAGRMPLWRPVSTAP